MLELLKYASCMFIAFTLPLLAILDWYYIVDIHFQVLSFQVCGSIGRGRRWCMYYWTVFGLLA